MKIIALDLAIHAGWCQGDSRASPREILSGSIQLARKDETFNQLVINFSGWLSAKIEGFRPELVCVEHWLPTCAQKREEAVDSSRLLHGACMAVCAMQKVPLVTVPVQTWRQQFAGHATASKAEKALDKQANKQMVWRRAVVLGYLPSDLAQDFDRSDAIGVFSYAAAIYGRAVPSHLTLFSAEACQ